jgi:hypothetical protein
MTDRFDRSKYEQQWPLPPQEIDQALPKPWYVTGYSHVALRNVLEVDYGIIRRARDNVFDAPGGELLYISRSEHLRGTRGGTLFALFPTYWSSAHREFDDILEMAHVRNLGVVALKTGHGRDGD